MNKNWETDGVVSALYGDGFKVSYSSSLYATDCVETALIKGEEYYILDGDFRQEYDGLVDLGFDACLEFFNKNKEDFESVWSTSNDKVPAQDQLQAFLLFLKELSEGKYEGR